MRAKDKLRVNWSKRDRTTIYHYPLGSQTKCDGGFLEQAKNDRMCEKTKESLEKYNKWLKEIVQKEESNEV